MNYGVPFFVRLPENQRDHRKLRVVLHKILDADRVGQETCNGTRLDLAVRLPCPPLPSIHSDPSNSEDHLSTILLALYPLGIDIP